jgi:hypothetical protein
VIDFGRDPVSFDQIFTCARCGRLVLRFVFAGRECLWDPSFVQRRFVRSYVGPQMIADVGFGPQCGTPHICALADVWAHAEEIKRLNERGAP